LLQANVGVERESTFMVGPGRQLTSLRHSSRARGGILPRWFKVQT